MDYFEDYKDMLQLFNKYKVKYLVVGAYAMGNYGYSRHTLDIEPMRIDILTDIDGVDFSEAWSNKTNNSLFGEEIHFISIHDLSKNKTSTGRTKDKYDVLELEKIIASRY